MAERVFGEIDGVLVGSVFVDRQALHDSGVHRPMQAGISGSGSEGADSIVVSGGYIDDEDHGDVIVYTGHGGNDPSTKRQIADQELTRGNLGLALDCDQGLPVRVVRGAGGEPALSPRSGYRYDGLYSVESYWPDTGRDGFRIWRFRLERRSDPITDTSTDGQTTPQRVESTVQRIVRNTAVASAVKRLHDYRCQICGERLETIAGPYAEGAHIRPLGRPHDGPDSLDNVLCLCPNHHVLFDRLAIHLDPQLTVRVTTTGEAGGRLRAAASHTVNPEHVAYHRHLCSESHRP